jgi:hypothetical protein
MENDYMKSTDELFGFLILNGAMHFFKGVKPLLFARGVLWFPQERTGGQPGHFGGEKISHP